MNEKLSNVAVLSIILGVVLLIGHLEYRWQHEVRQMEERINESR